MTDRNEMKTTGLGDFWRCLHSDIAKSSLAFLSRMDDYEVIGAAESPPGTNLEPSAHMVLWDPMVDSVMWLTPVSDGFELASHYPTVISGCGEVDAILISTTNWEPHLEGLVEVQVGAWQLAYFDIFFPVSRIGYQPGESLRVSLSGLAMALWPLSAIGERAAGSSFATTTISDVYETGETWLGHPPSESHPRDYYMVFGKLTQVDVGAFGDLTLYRCRIDLMPGVSIPVVFGPSSIKEEGWPPQSGSWVSMLMLLHGYRTGHGPVQNVNVVK